MKVIVRRLAEREAGEAKAWYETRNQSEEERLGEAFMTELRHVIDGLRRLPKRFPVVVAPLRRALLRRFPYAVYFYIRGNQEVVVVAILHVRRDARRIDRRR